MPIFISSIIFAGQHFRKEAPMVKRTYSCCCWHAMALLEY